MGLAEFRASQPPKTLVPFARTGKPVERPTSSAPACKSPSDTVTWSEGLGVRVLGFGVSG